MKHVSSYSPVEIADFTKNVCSTVVFFGTGETCSKEMPFVVTSLPVRKQSCEATWFREIPWGDQQLSFELLEMSSNVYAYLPGSNYLFA